MTLTRTTCARARVRRRLQNNIICIIVRYLPDFVPFGRTLMRFSYLVTSGEFNCLNRVYRRVKSRLIRVVSRSPGYGYLYRERCPTRRFVCFSSSLLIRIDGRIYTFFTFARVDGIKNSTIPKYE